MATMTWNQAVERIDGLKHFENRLQEPIFDEPAERQLVGMMLTYPDLCHRRPFPTDSFVDKRAELVYKHLPDRSVDYPAVKTAESLEIVEKLHLVPASELLHWIESFTLSGELNINEEYKMLLDRVEQWRKKRRLLQALDVTKEEVSEGCDPDEAMNRLTNRIFEGVDNDGPEESGPQTDQLPF